MYAAAVQRDTKETVLIETYWNVNLFDGDRIQTRNEY